MRKAVLQFEDKMTYPDGAVLEMRVWRLPKADAQRSHGLKYSLYYGKNGGKDSVVIELPKGYVPQFRFNSELFVASEKTPGQDAIVTPIETSPPVDSSPVDVSVPPTPPMRETRRWALVGLFLFLVLGLTLWAL